MVHIFASCVTLTLGKVQLSGYEFVVYFTKKAFTFKTKQT